MLLMPTWSIVPSRFWKAQVAVPGPPLPRRHVRRTRQRRLRPARGRRRVHRRGVSPRTRSPSWTPPGPTGPSSSALSCGAAWAVHAGRGRTPSGCSGLWSPSRRRAGSTCPRPTATRYWWGEPRRRHRGLGEVQQVLLARGRLRRLRPVLLRRRCSPSRTPPSRSRTASAGRTRSSPQTLADTTAGRLGLRRRGRARRSSRSARGCSARCSSSTAPTTSIRPLADGRAAGRADRRRAGPRRGRRARAHGARPGAGQPRDPARSSTGLPAAAAPRRWSAAAAARPPKRALYLSSPIGLGHARRDVAIAAELRRLHPDLQIDWLAQHPVTRVLAAARRARPPGVGAGCANESGHIEHECGEHDLHAFQAIRRMDEILVEQLHGLRRRRRTRSTTTW